MPVEGEASGGTWADEVLQQGYRLAQLEDHRSEMMVEWRNLENEIRTLEDENASLKRALKKEQKKVARVRLRLEAFSSPGDVGPTGHHYETNQPTTTKI